MNRSAPKETKSTSGSWLSRWIQAVKEFLFPNTEAKRKIRYNQAFHIGAFIASTIAFIYFEERIVKLISLEANEISKGRFGGPAPF